MYIYNLCSFLLSSMCLVLIIYVFVCDKRLNGISTQIEGIIDIYKIFNYLMKLENNRQKIAFKKLPWLTVTRVWSRSQNFLKNWSRSWPWPWPWLPWVTAVTPISNVDLDFTHCIFDKECLYDISQVMM
jgi:hypothetical protein